MTKVTRVQPPPSGGDADGEASREPAPAARPGLYETIFRRRDVRGQFTGEPIEPAVLRRILDAAHAAPSVGLSQPWDFLIVDDPVLKQQFWEHVQTERDSFAATLEGDRAERFARIKIDGVLESSLSLVVTYDTTRGQPAVLGRHSIDDAGLYSVCLAIQNLWLAATAEGWGVGWVSFYREPVLAELTGLPDHVQPVAWLCLGPVDHLEDVPDLERHGWRNRRPLDEALHWNQWGEAASRRSGASASRDL